MSTGIIERAQRVQRFDRLDGECVAIANAQSTRNRALVHREGQEVAVRNLNLIRTIAGNR